MISRNSIASHLGVCFTHLVEGSCRMTSYILRFQRSQYLSYTIEGMPAGSLVCFDSDAQIHFISTFCCYSFPVQFEYVHLFPLGPNNRSLFV